MGWLKRYRDQRERDREFGAAVAPIIQRLVEGLDEINTSDAPVRPMTARELQYGESEPYWWALVRLGSGSDYVGFWFVAVDSEEIIGGELPRCGSDIESTNTETLIVWPSYVAESTKQAVFAVAAWQLCCATGIQQITQGVGPGGQPTLKFDDLRVHHLSIHEPPEASLEELDLELIWSPLLPS